MKIVIDIDENVFTRLFDNGIEDYEIVNDDLFAIAKSIRKGTTLQEPKTGHWIPVSERLPEHCQNVLFSTKTDRVFEGKYFKDETDHQWHSFRDECFAWNDESFAWNNVVTAWMPLPEPYKAESEKI